MVKADRLRCITGRRPMNCYESLSCLEFFAPVFKPKITPRNISKQIKIPTTAQNPGACSGSGKNGKKFLPIPQTVQMNQNGIDRKTFMTKLISQPTIGIAFNLPPLNFLRTARGLNSICAEQVV